MIKKILFCLMLGSNLYSEGTVNVIEIMQHLEYSTSLILKGFLHNQRPLIDEGREKLKKSLIELKGVNPKVYLPSHKRNLEVVIFNNFARMDEQLELMGEYLNKKEMNRAYNAFDRILNGCFKCHAVVRGW